MRSGESDGVGGNPGALKNRSFNFIDGRSIPTIHVNHFNLFVPLLIVRVVYKQGKRRGVMEGR